MRNVISKLKGHYNVIVHKADGLGHIGYYGLLLVGDHELIWFVAGPLLVLSVLETLQRGGE